MPSRRTKKDPIRLKRVKTYMRRNPGVKFKEAADAIELMQFSGPREPEVRLADAMFGAGLNSAVVKSALGGLWSDYKSPIAQPKLDLVKMLREGGHDDLAVRVENGEFDG